MTENILTVRGLDKRFGGIHVTQAIDFDLRKGEQSAIIGPNGAGKSTFFNLLTGYHRPDRGKILFDGVDITSWPPHRIVKAGISRAFQVSNIFGRMTVHENVRAAVHAHAGVTFRLFAPAARFGGDEVAEALDRCGLAGQADTVAGDLSQGDKKKLELAIALAGRPRLLFLDEPTAGMSIQETEDTMQLVDRLNRELEISVLFTEHDMGVVFNHAQRISLLHRGSFLVAGTPDEIRQNELVKRVYLGEGI